MIRTVVGLHSDAEGHWVAELSCLHRQHVRHQPPFQDRAWTLTEEGRAARIGTEIDCPLCDRAELPQGLRVTRTAGPFTAETVPPGLQADHRVAEGTWGRLRVLEGSVRFRLATEPPIDVVLGAGDAQPIPPLTPHNLSVVGPMRIEVDFLVAD